MNSAVSRDTPPFLKVIFFLLVILILILTVYRVYLIFYEPKQTGLHSRQIQRIIQDARTEEPLHFMVVGNIQNSVGLFENQMIPLLNQASPDFIVSAGDAVGGGGEDRYRALTRTFENLKMPYLLTVGRNESSVFGSFYFYEYFGPYFYSFERNQSQFIFLDSTDPDTYAFQVLWLQQLLEGSNAANRFVFIGQPLFKPSVEPALEFGGLELTDPAFRDQLHSLFQEYEVTAIFSGTVPIYDSQIRDGVRYIITGGAGGLVLGTEESFPHYVDVLVTDTGVEMHSKQLNLGQNRVQRAIEGVWFMIHSFFYSGYVNFFLIIGLLALLAIRLYSMIFVDHDYYQNYALNVEPYLQQKIRVVMFTNNYLPFIGGVPISIDRLHRGLQAIGHSVQIIAPGYKNAQGDSENIVRVRSLLRLSSKGDFRLANIFSPKISAALRSFKPDIIHVHHPFWLGEAGVMYARVLKIPVILTYHTRLEHYSHYFPLPGALFRNLIAHSLIRRFANRCTGVIVPTESAGNYLRMIGVQSPVFVQPTGIEYERLTQHDTTREGKIREQLGLSEDEFVLLSVSRLSREKNIDFIIQAMSELRQRIEVPFRCVLIGKGNERDRIQSRISELKLSDHVLLAGAVPPEEMSGYYGMADMFVFASTSETQGMVILEAMAAGLPVVAVRSSGIDDVVRDGETGFKTVQNIDTWTGRVEYLLTNDKVRQQMSAAAQKFASQYSIDNFARSVAAAYAEVRAIYDSESR